MRRGKRTPNWPFVMREKIANLETELAATRKRSEQRRVLMEKWQWVDISFGSYNEECLECEREEAQGHKSTCLWAQAIEKGE